MLLLDKTTFELFELGIIFVNEYGERYCKLYRLYGESSGIFPIPYESMEHQFEIIGWL